MENVQSSVIGLDPVWDRLINEAHEVVENEPLLGGVVHTCVLHHSSIEEA
ncbi:MAG: serine O-acetyltransferase, partial [Rhodobacteraceae bacterium]|nr:serine O-acetyltransferase [Paracoccaceae bacterium]